jgi:hypothetical protein
VEKKGAARFFLAMSLLAFAAGAKAGETITYAYDALGRLVATSSSGTSNNGLTTSLGYDSAGNRACYRVGGNAGPCPPPPPAPDPGPPPAAPIISVGNSSAAEGNPLVFILSKDGTAAATVSWSSVAGTALSGDDYVAGGGSVSFAAGETSKTVSLATLTDSLAEANETLSVHIFNPVGATLGNPAGVGTILDAKISVGDASASEGSPLTFTLTRTGNGAASVPWSLADVTATVGDDYAAGSGVVSFADGESIKTVTVPTMADSIAEVTETMRIQLGNPTGASLANPFGTGTILDVAAPPPPGNNPPTAVNDSKTVRRCSTTFVDVLANDSDPDGDTPLTLVAVTGDGFSVHSATEIEVVSDGLSSGASATYSVKDSRGATATATLSITISGGSCTQ